MERVRFYFDFTSPYSYLASARVDAFATRTGASVEWLPTLLGGVMKGAGNTPPILLPVRAAYLVKDLARSAAFHGVPFRMSPHFPLTTLPALRAAWALKTARPSAFPAFVHACFRAVWVDGLDLGDRAVMVALAREEDRNLVAAAPDATEWKDAVRRATEEAVAAGAYGLPAFVLDEGELFFGNDRLERARMAAHRRALR